MDRINKFLNQRPKKNERTLNFRGKTFVVTKEDMKKVRNYKSGKNIGRVVSQRECTSSQIDEKIKNLDLNHTEKAQWKAIADSEKFTRRFSQKMEKIKQKKKSAPEKIVDIFPEEGISSLEGYEEQPWIFNIKESYSGPVEALRTESAREIEELRMRYEKPVRKTARLEDFTKYKTTVYEMEVAATRNISVVEHDRNILLTEDGNFFDVHSGALEKTLSEKTSNLHFMISGTSLFSREDGKKALLSLNEPIRSFDVNEDTIAVNSTTTVFFYNRQFELLGNFKFSSEKIIRVELLDSAGHVNVILSTSHGIRILCSDKIVSRIPLNYVIDFDRLSGRKTIFAVNNLCRLVRIHGKKIVSFQLKEIPDAVKVFDTGCFYLIAVMFRDHVQLFKQNHSRVSSSDVEIIPCGEIKETFIKNIFWDTNKPFLFVSTSNNLKMYS